MIRNAIWVQWNISSDIQFHMRSMQVYLGVHLTFFHSNALRHESEFSLCWFQYIDIDKRTQKKLQYYAFLDQLNLVMDSQQSAWNRQFISGNNHERFSVVSSGADYEVKPFLTYSSTWIFNIYYFNWLMKITALCESPLI